MGRLGFLSQFLKKENSVGAIAPSSRLLAKKLMKAIDFGKGRTFVELGAGTGTITMEILKNMHEDAVLFVFETNESFCQRLERIQDPRLVIVHGSAEHIIERLEEHGVKQVDVVLSSIPFTIVPKDVKDRIMNGVIELLGSEGIFFQFQYSLESYRYFKRLFGEVKLDFMAYNLPPAFIYTCKEGKELEEG
jgi:phospholipid N-methyltransferase